MPSIRAVASPIWQRRLVLVTGKGGVGKTSVTAALARAAHRAGRRVIVGEIAPDLHGPSPLLGLFGAPRPKPDELVDLEPRLRGVRLAPATGHRRMLMSALKIRLLVDQAMKSAALHRFLNAAPTFPEIGILFHLAELLRDDSYDHLILDMPATGHAVGLAQLPHIVSRVVPTGIIGDAMKETIRRFSDPNHTRAVVVTLPEALPVTESLELVAALGKQQVAVGSAVLNRMPPSPFDDAELGALRTFLDAHPGRVLGARELRRLERALAAREEFRAKTPAGVERFEIPLLDTTEPSRVVAALGERLGGGA